MLLKLRPKKLLVFLIVGFVAASADAQAPQDDGFADSLEAAVAASRDAVELKDAQMLAPIDLNWGIE